MKLCASPANTSCMYQRRLARDQAPADGSSDAFAELYQFLAAKLDQRDLPEAEQLLRRFLEASGGEGSGAGIGATDEPLPFTTPAMDAQIRRGRAQASSYLFSKRFPGASRIRNV